MKILNNQQFASFAEELSRKSIADEKENGLDALEYRWLLTDILSSIKEQYQLEIKQDSDGSYEIYKILKAEINDKQTNELTLSLEREKDRSMVNRTFNLKFVEDQRIPKYVKYYVDTENEKYTFLIRK